MEMIVGLFLLSLLMLVIFNLFPTSLFAVSHSEIKGKADHLAQTYLNRERARPFDELQLGERVESVKVDGIDMTTTIIISQVPGSDENLLKSLKVRVSWQGRSGAKERIHEVWRSRVRK